MTGLLYHPATARQVESFIKSPSHALMLVGPSGSGKDTLAFSLAADILNEKSLDNYPYKLLLSSKDGKAIGVEAVRELEHFLSLKVPRSNAYNRVVVIQNAESLSTEAQNALLKTLEEPPADTLIILNTAYSQALLPTVRSRAQVINVKQPEKQAVIDYFTKESYEPKQIEQAYAISGGLPGLMKALLEDSEHPLLIATEKARDILKASTYERLLMVDELSKNKSLAQDTVYILGQMAHVSLQSAGSTATKWQNILTASHSANKALMASAQPKLVLSNLVLSI